MPTRAAPLSLVGCCFNHEENRWFVSYLQILIPPSLPEPPPCQFTNVVALNRHLLGFGDTGFHVQAGEFMSLELNSFQQALASLSATLEKSEDQDLMRGLDETLQAVIRAGAIKNFEIVYELSWKFIRRWLEMNVSREIADGVTRRELFRLGVENRLIDDVDTWMLYHMAHNQTSHTYRQSTADQVYGMAPGLLLDAQRLLHNLEVRND